MTQQDQYAEFIALLKQEARALVLDWVDGTPTIPIDSEYKRAILELVVYASGGSMDEDGDRVKAELGLS